MINVSVTVLFNGDHRITNWQADRFEPNRVNRVFRDYVNKQWGIDKVPTGAVVIVDGEVYQYTAGEVAELAGDAK